MRCPFGSSVVPSYGVLRHNAALRGIASGVGGRSAAVASENEATFLLQRAHELRISSMQDQRQTEMNHF